jgi:hypothetical protein
VHTHPAEIGAKAWLEEGAGHGIERLAGRIQRLVHNGRRDRRFCAAGVCFLFMKFVFFFAFGAFAVEFFFFAFGTLAPHYCRSVIFRESRRGIPWIRHAHYLLSYPIGFVLQGIVHRTDFELRLEGARRRRGERDRPLGAILGIKRKYWYLAGLRQSIPR